MYDSEGPLCFIGYVVSLRKNGLLLAEGWDRKNNQYQGGLMAILYETIHSFIHH